ncbi:MAG: hypothetical protein CMH83_03860 [Nocardioides sp.]|nr:hypothetical protein [Nocardioides sp.]
MTTSSSDVHRAAVATWAAQLVGRCILTFALSLLGSALLFALLTSSASAMVFAPFVAALFVARILHTAEAPQP